MIPNSVLNSSPSVNAASANALSITGYDSSEEKVNRRKMRGAPNAISEIRRPEFIRSFSSLVIRLHCRRVDRCKICIKSAKQARLIALRFRLQPSERLFGYKE
jgi:hypothetical protein